MLPLKSQNVPQFGNPWFNIRSALTLTVIEHFFNAPCAPTYNAYYDVISFVRLKNFKSVFEVHSCIYS